jgi:hypothetical protein
MKNITPNKMPAVADRFRFKKNQREDYARAAMHDGCILGHDTGCGKGLALFVWPALKVGFERSLRTATGTDSEPIGLRPLAAVLLVAPGDLHNQVIMEGRDKFRAKVMVLDSQEKFLQLSSLNPRTGERTLPPGYYLSSYTQLASNGVTPLPKFDGQNILGMMQLLGIGEGSAIEFFNDRGRHFRRAYERLSASPLDSAAQLEMAWHIARKQYDTDKWRDEVDEDYKLLKNFATPNGGCDSHFNDLEDEQQAFVLHATVSHIHRECQLSIGETRYYKPILKADSPAANSSPTHHSSLKVKCVYSPSLADLCQDAFAACALDEGVKVKGEDTIVGLGVRQIAARYKLVLTATPIKNRLPDIFRLAWWATGARADAHARFPYPDSSAAREEFAGEFLISERNLTKEEMSETNRRYLKLTPQVCNLHRLWKMLGPIVLRRRKKDFGEDIVAKHRHIVRVPMGREQAAVYKFHLEANYIDRNGMPAVGAKLQALRIAAANPASRLLVRPHGDMKTKGEARSRSAYVPKVVSCLKLIQQILERGEQVVVFSAFHDSLDALSSRLNEADIRHAVCDGRMSQKKRGLIAEQFKLGPPKAGRPVASRYPLLLGGVECFSEGHSFNLCNNVILMCYSWAYDKFEQAINRVHRLNSLWDVNVYPIICEGSIDRKLEAMIQEKGDAAELVLDGHLLGEHQSEVNLAELLHIAQKEFSASGTGHQTIEESSLEADWPKLRLLLGRAMQSWSAGIVECPTAATCPMEFTMCASQAEVRPVLKTPDSGLIRTSSVHHRSIEDETVTVRKDSDDVIFEEMPLWKQAFRPGIVVSRPII